MMNKLFKSIAIALAAVTFSMPLSGTALAASSHGHRNAKPASSHRVMQRTSTHKAPAIGHKAPSLRKAPAIGHRTPVVHRAAPRPGRVVHPVVHRAPAPRPHYHGGSYHHHSSTGNFVTGAIIGAILGAVIANNTSSDY